MAKFRALSFGAATIVNAIASGRGAAFGVDLETRAEVELAEPGVFEASIAGFPGEETKLVECSAREVFDHFGVDFGARLKTESSIPIARGLKSSSAAANAVVLACVEAVLSEHPDFVRPSDLELVKLGVEAALKANVSVTGAFDDASASFFGGFVVTDNLGREIVTSGEMELLSVLFFVPEEKTYTSQVDVGRARMLSREALAVWDLACAGHLYPALTLNGILYSAILGRDPEIALSALGAGALAAGLCGTGPAVAALAEDPESIKEAWRDLEGSIISAKVNNSKAHVLK